MADALRGRPGKYDIIDRDGACVAADLTFLGVIRALEKASDDDITRAQLAATLEKAIDEVREETGDHEATITIIVGGHPEAYTVVGDPLP